MTSNINHCSFILLAEFDIDQGAQLTYQFPQPLGTDEGLLAMLMLPDGAEKQLEDWTIFFLNQTPFNTIAPVLALETPDVDGSPSSDDSDKSELLYVLNLVRTKHNKAARRGAEVKAMAICTRHPFIQVFKPVLLMALDDYFSDPSQDCLARLFDAINSMDLSGAPMLTRHEKVVMRSSERKDVFAEKFIQPTADPQQAGSNGVAPSKPHHRSTNSIESSSSFEEGIVMRRERDSNAYRDPGPHGRERAGTGGSSVSVPSSQQYSQNHHQNSPTEVSFGSAVWVGDESGLLETTDGGPGASTASLIGSSTLVSSRGRRSTDASSNSSHAPGRSLATTTASVDQHLRTMSQDTHFYNTTISYKGHKLPIKMPLSTFPEEVGDYSLITLIKVFSSTQLVSGPIHPHLHTNGPQTHPIIILFNALITGKRIIFMGHGRPAGQVSNFVLSACALGSGGAVLRGFIERAFPYANLRNKDEWESVPAYIAGVTNLIFKSSGMWDVLFDVASGQVVVHKDIHINHPPPTTTHSIGATPLIITRSGTLKAESATATDEEMGRIPTKDSQKPDATARADSDNLFIEDIRSAIEYHFGESLVRTRFTEYVTRFVRLASRYEEETQGSTKLGYPSASFKEGSPSSPAQLGSGIVFVDDIACARELVANASRIEGWRRTNTYQYCIADFNKSKAVNAIKGFDVLHQLFRFRQTKNMPDAEVELIMRTLAENVRSYDQVVELLACLAPHGGGLLHLSFGLLHQQEIIRELTVDIFNELRLHPVGVLSLQMLNHFQRYAYVRQAHAREARVRREQQLHRPPPLSFMSRTSSNRSDSSLIGSG